MLKNEPLSKLYEMHMDTIAAHFTAQQNDLQYRELSFAERFSMLVDAEWAARKTTACPGS